MQQSICEQRIASCAERSFLRTPPKTERELVAPAPVVESGKHVGRFRDDFGSTEALGREQRGFVFLLRSAALAHLLEQLTKLDQGQGFLACLPNVAPDRDRSLVPASGFPELIRPSVRPKLLGFADELPRQRFVSPLDRAAQPRQQNASRAPTQAVFHPLC
jgi:hypothetical protein